MRVLVAYGSKRGGTAGLAEMLGEALRRRGLSVDVDAAGTVDSPAAYDAFVVAGAVYTGRWHKEAKRFVRANRELLSSRPVWLVQSGPLDDSATHGEVALAPGVKKFAAMVGAHAAVTFGGRLEPDAKGFVADSLAKSHSGDWRDAAQVEDFADAVAGVLEPTTR